MDFSIPHNKPSELALYIWKIIDIPIISKTDLLYQISFKLSLLPPEKANKFVEECIKKNIIEKKSDNQIKISQTLEKEVLNWQYERKKSIINMIEKKFKAISEVKRIETSKTNEFAFFIKVFSERSVLNRAAAIPDNDLSINEFDIEKGRISASIKGTSKTSYMIEIALGNKCIKHDCYDYTERKSKDKKFCKHLTKLFLLLKSKNEAATITFLEKITNEISDWTFSH